jgi:hypothetical protein
MKDKLPDSIVTFFDVSNGVQTQRLPHCFTENAAVRDEGITHNGHEAIGLWLRDSQQKFTYTVEPLEASLQGAIIRVRARVVGNFPGSPVELNHAFTLNGDRIEFLEITA